MNQGQYNAVLGMLTEIRDLLKAQKPTIIAVPNDANAMQIMEELNQINQPAKRRGRPKKAD